MANVINPRDLSAQVATFPGMKPPVVDLGPLDDGDPAEVDAFNAMIRKLRDHGPNTAPSGR